MKNLIVFGFLILSSSIFAQNEEVKTSAEPVSPETVIRATIDAMFTGMRNGDSSMVANVFHKDLRLMSSYTTKKGESKIHVGSLIEFTTAVGTPHDAIWDERISNVVIQRDDNLAQVWMDYSFYLDDKFSHCGANSFQLVNSKDGWKIISITDTRRGTDCASDVLNFKYIADLQLFPDLFISYEFKSEPTKAQLQLIKDLLKDSFNEAYISGVSKDDGKYSTMLDFQGTEVDKGVKQIELFVQKLNSNELAGIIEAITIK